VSPVRYELGFYIPEDDILHSHRHENLKSYKVGLVYFLLYKARYALESFGWFALGDKFVRT
jgi:hypothetical protein